MITDVNASNANGSEHNFDRGQCLVPRCKKNTVLRGLCKSHYQYARNLVAEGQTTWGKLQASGKVTTTKQISHSELRYFFLGEE